MKKFLALVLGALFVLSFAASAFAIHAEIPAETQAVIAKGTTQMEIGGLLRIRHWWRSNITGVFGGNPIDQGDHSRFDQRVRFHYKAQVTPNVLGYVNLQGDWNWGGGSGPRANAATGPNQMRDELSVLEAWIQYTGSGLFGFPAGLKIGHMPLSLGHEKFFQHTTDNNDALVVWIDPTKALHIAGLFIKFDEQEQTDNTDDMDGWVALMTYDAGDAFKGGINYTYIHRADFGPDPAPVPVGDRLGLDFQNIGLHADGSIGAFGYKGQLDFQFGDATDNLDMEAWGLWLAANYNFNPVNLRASFAYGSGDDDPLDGDLEEFQTFLSVLPHGVGLIYDYNLNTTAYAQLSNGLGGPRANTGYANTTMYNLGLDFDMSKNVKAKLDGYLLYATETLAGVDDEAGWEVDAGLVYTVARNLKLYFDVGYFDAGDFYQDTLGPDADEEAVLTRTQFILSF